jgi:hypothetical protein
MSKIYGNTDCTTLITRLISDRKPEQPPARMRSTTETERKSNRAYNLFINKDDILEKIENFYEFCSKRYNSSQFEA